MKKTLIALFPLFVIVVAGFFFSKKPFNKVEEGAVPSSQSSESAPMSAVNPSQNIATTPSAPTEKQVEVLNAVLSSHNDNDPRLDSELKVLSPEAKISFVKKYETVPAELRNDRGTIVFLLGRNLQTENDIAFMGKVLREEPCRGLKNCREDMPSSDPHGETGIEVTLAYPQIMALKSLERILSQGESHPLFRRSMDEVKAATNSPVDKIARVAKDLEAKYSKR